MGSSILTMLTERRPAIVWAMLASVVLLPSPLAPVTSTRPAFLSHQRSTTGECPNDFRSQSRTGYVGNSPQSRLRRSTHFRENDRHHEPATRNQSAIRFPASPVVPPSKHRQPISLYLPQTAALPPGVG